MELIIAICLFSFQLLCLPITIEGSFLIHVPDLNLIVLNYCWLQDQRILNPLYILYLYEKHAHFANKMRFNQAIAIVSEIKHLIWDSIGARTRHYVVTSSVAHLHTKQKESKQRSDDSIHTIALNVHRFRRYAWISRN